MSEQEFQKILRTLIKCGYISTGDDGITLLLPQWVHCLWLDIMCELNSSYAAKVTGVMCFIYEEMDLSDRRVTVDF